MEWLAENSKLIGLLFFFSVFMLILIVTYWPGKSKLNQERADIPLKGNDTVKGGS